MESEIINDKPSRPVTRIYDEKPVVKVEDAKVEAIKVEAVKADVAKSNTSSLKKFTNILNSLQTIGFEGRTVTWRPFEAIELSASEIAFPAFQLRKINFKEVK